MSDVSLRTDIKLATQTLAKIEASGIASNDDGLRPHLGASIIGRECGKALWYSFRWATKPDHSARLLRLFARGQREEEVFTALLRAAGITVVTHDPNSGEQYRFKTGHFGGSLDAACVGLPDAPKTWHLVEYKTSSEKLFNTLVKDGVQQAKPEHVAQMQVYMAWSGMTRALYMAVCKNTDRLHLERIDYDKAAADALFAKAKSIINAAEPPAGISERPDWYQCKCCDHHAVCHTTAAPLPTCRSCAHSTPVDNGTWACEKYRNTLSVAAQKAACPSHLFIPSLLANWAKPLDATENDVQYKNTLTGYGFSNGRPPDAHTSLEIHAAQDKRAVGDPVVQEFREEFDGRLVA